MGLIAEPAYFLLNMTDGPYLTGHPGTPEGLQAHLRFLPGNLRLEWAPNIVGGDLLSLCEMTARLGGHVAPGIGDYAYKALGPPPNEEVVRRAADIARSAGREIASPDDPGDPRPIIVGSWQFSVRDCGDCRAGTRHSAERSSATWWGHRETSSLTGRTAG
jgi:beta-keto acid cleavage enzyme